MSTEQFPALLNLSTANAYAKLLLPCLTGTELKALVNLYLLGSSLCMNNGSRLKPTLYFFTNKKKPAYDMTHSVPVQCETRNTWFPSVSFLVMLCNTNCREVKYHLWVKKKVVPANCSPGWLCSRDHIQTIFNS